MPLWIQLLAKFLGFICWLTPWWVRRCFAHAIAFLWFEVFRFRRWTLLKNVTIAFPEKSKVERVRLAKDSLLMLGTNLIEFLSLPMVSKEYAAKKVVFHGLENYEKALAQKKGILFLSLHLGNGDFGCAMMSLRGIKLHLISKKFHSKALNSLWFGVRESMGTKFIDPHSSKNAFEILGAMRRNEGVVFVLDQFMGKPFGIETRFFGKKTGTAYGLALFAIKTQAPVIPVYTYRDDQDQTHVVIAPEILPIATSGIVMDRDLQIQQTTQQYNDWIESAVRAHPNQWMWIHRRWKKWE